MKSLKMNKMFDTIRRKGTNGELNPGQGHKAGGRFANAGGRVGSEGDPPRDSPEAAASQSVVSFYGLFNQATAAPYRLS